MAGINLGIFTKFHDDGIKDAEGAFGKLGSLAKAGGLAVAAGLAVATAAATALGVASVRAASDFSETATAVEQVFGSAAGSLEQFAKTADKTMGQSQTQFLNAAKTFGIFGKAAGMSSEENANFSQTLSVLASDLASFNNTSVDTAITAIGAALRGESEPIRQFGVLLDDATLKARAAAMGIASGNAPLTQQQRVLAAYNEIMAQTTTQQGDFARTAGGMANGMRIISAMFDNLKIQIGNAFLPLMLQVVPVIQDFLSKLTASPAFAAFIEGLATTFGQLLEVLVPLLDPIMQLIQSLLPPLMDIIKVLAPVVGELVKIFVPLAGIIAKLAAELIVDLVKILGEVVKLITDNPHFLDGLIQSFKVLEAAIAPVKFTLEAIYNVLKWINDNQPKYTEQLNFIRQTAPAAIDLQHQTGIAATQLTRSTGLLPESMKHADGGIVTGPQFGLIGEAGPEAIIPLDKFDSVVGGRGINITVNAGMGTDGAALGEQIVNAIRRYERTSGAVFARA